MMAEDTGKSAAEEKEDEKASSKSGLEGIYDRLPDISIRSLDWFIVICVIALVAVVLIGVLKARHII